MQLGYWIVIGISAALIILGLIVNLLGDPYDIGDALGASVVWAVGVICVAAFACLFVWGYYHDEERHDKVKQELIDTYHIQDVQLLEGSDVTFKLGDVSCRGTYGYDSSRRYVVIWQESLFCNGPIPEIGVDG